MRFYFLVISISLLAGPQLSFASRGNEVVSVETQEGLLVPTRLGECMVSVQKAHKKLTPADSAEVPMISLEEALEDPACPQVTEEIRAAFRAKKIRVAQEFGIDSQGRTYNTIGGNTFRSDGTTYQRFGDFGVGSDGSTQTHFGNSTINSDGSTVTYFGNRK